MYVCMYADNQVSSRERTALTVYVCMRAPLYSFYVCECSCMWVRVSTNKYIRVCMMDERMDVRTFCVWIGYKLVDLNIHDTHTYIHIVRGVAWYTYTCPSYIHVHAHIQSNVNVGTRDGSATHRLFYILVHVWKRISIQDIHHSVWGSVISCLLFIPTFIHTCIHTHAIHKYIHNP